MAQQIVFTCGSRRPARGMRDIARRIVQHARAQGARIRVGDADGWDDIIIQLADELGADVEVVGAYGRLRHVTTTGVNRTVPHGYDTRDRLLVDGWTGTEPAAQSHLQAERILRQEARSRTPARAPRVEFPPADVCVAGWNGESQGTASIFEYAVARGLAAVLYDFSGTRQPRPQRVPAGLLALAAA